jgi:hypothetical protein
MQKLPDFVPAFSHYLKPLMRDGAQFTCMLFHPRINGGIPLDGAVESEEIGSHRPSTFSLRDLTFRSSLNLIKLGAPLLAYFEKWGFSFRPISRLRKFVVQVMHCGYSVEHA